MSNNTICSSATKCNLTLMYSNDSLILGNVNMSNSGIGLFSYGLSQVQTSQKGEYKSIVYCYDGKTNGYLATWLVLNNNGDPPLNNGSLTIFIYLLFIVSTIGLLYTFLKMIANVFSLNITFYDVLVSWALYILMIIVFYMSNEYLVNTFVVKQSAFFLQISQWTNGVMPVIFLIVTIIIKIFDKQGKLSSKEIGGRLG